MNCKGTVYDHNSNAVGWYAYSFSTGIYRCQIGNEAPIRFYCKEEMVRELNNQGYVVA